MATDGSELRAREGVTDSIAGFLAAFAIFAGALAIVWYPGRLGPAAMLVGLIAAALGGTQRRFAAIALAIATTFWFVGMVIAVITDRPVF